MSGRRGELTQDPRVQALLDERASRLARAESDADEAQQTLLAEFVVGEELYAVPLAQVCAAVPLRLVTPVPLAPRHVLGILRYRDENISAVNLAAVLGVRGRRQDSDVLMVVDLGGGRLVAFDTEGSPRTRALSTAVIDRARAARSDAIVAVPVEERWVHLVDLGALLARVEESRGG